jgi:ABC-type transporter Mla subunit MlaD
VPISPFDIAIILISSVACIYCIVLSRRLRALQNTRNGLGATIKALSDSISAVSATTDETRYHAGELAARLARLIEEAKSSCERVETLTQRLNEAHDRASTYTPPVHQPVPAPAPAPTPSNGAVQEALDESNQRLQEITEMMHRLKDLSEQSVAEAEKEVPVLRPLPTQLRPRMKVV